MKKILIYLLLLLIQSDYVYSQKLANREASLYRYGQTVYPFFKSLHETYYRNQFDGQWKQYEALISFNIDTLGEIENIKLESTKSLPDSVTSYMKELLLKSNGLWRPSVKNGIEDLSDTIFLHFTIIRRGCLGALLFKLTAKQKDDLFEESEQSLSGTHPNQALYDRITRGSDKPNHFIITIGFD